MHAENMFDRSDLLELSRKELQTKAKLFGVPANMKTAEIVELMMAKASQSSAAVSCRLPSVWLHLLTLLRFDHHRHATNT